MNGAGTLSPDLAEGNAYDFAFGLNWAGVIEDARTATYRKGSTATYRN